MRTLAWEDKKPRLLEFIRLWFANLVLVSIFTEWLPVPTRDRGSDLTGKRWLLLWLKKMLC